MSLFGSIAKIAGDVGKIAGGFAAAGPVGGLVGAASIFGNTTPRAAPPSAGFGVNLPGIAAFGGGITLGGSKTTSYTGGISWQSAGAGGACPKGYHLNKHALPASKTHQAVPARSICVRNRRMNPLNHRADARALRRLKRADKMTRKIHSLFHHTRHVTGKKR